MIIKSSWLDYNFQKFMYVYESSTKEESENKLYWSKVLYTIGIKLVLTQTTLFWAKALILMPW
jgi:hypothetical protein